MHKNNQTGRTMIEVISVLGLISVVAVGVMSIINSSIEKYKISAVASQIIDLQKLVTARYATKGNYAELASGDDAGMQDVIEKLIAEKAVPRDMVVPAYDTPPNELKNIYHGTVSINILDSGVAAALGLTGLEEQYFSVMFEGLSKGACMSLLNISWRKQDRSDVIAIQVFSEATPEPANEDDPPQDYFSIYLKAPSGGDYQLPLSVEDIASMCSDGNNNAIAWSFF